LFCRNDNQWKLTDFGVSAVATSKKAVATLHSRGTASYRPPELLGEDAEFTNKVDIWALGCVLHELSTGKVAFREDWTVRQYSFDTEPLPISFPSIPKFLENHMSRNILHLLSKKWNDRPGASKACEIFSSYCEFLKSLRELAFQLQWGPTYDEWTKLLMDTPDGSKDFLIRIADLFETNGRKDIAVHLRREPSGNGKGSKPATDANPDAITQIGAQMSTLNIPSTLVLPVYIFLTLAFGVPCSPGQCVGRG
jgi:serine/threonine protein kinase